MPAATATTCSTAWAATTHRWGAGNDLLDGGTGDREVDGGDGNDTYVVDADDTIDETAPGSDGTDTVRSSADGYTLPAGVENITLTGTAPLDATGNDADIVDRRHRRRHAQRRGRQ